MSRIDIINNIDNFKRRIKEHQDKIRNNPNDRTVSHWEAEIENFTRQMEKLERELNVSNNEAYCPMCERTVSLNGNKCPKCRYAIV